MPHILLQQVLEFHKKFKKTIGDPQDPKVQEQKFRLDLIDEEYAELLEALNNPDLSDDQRITEIADALGDLTYVIFGAAICWGIDLASVIDAIHESNMTKSLDKKRPDGKVLKGKNYKPPKIKEALELAAYEISKDGYGEDSWWPEPTDLDQEPGTEVTQKIMLAAKDQAKLLAMKSIKQDLAPGVKSNGLTEKGKPYTINAGALQDISELTKEGFKAVTGHMTSYGAYVFECPCGRTHAVQAKLGSRGGLAPVGRAECMCGKAFVVDFTTGATPHVTQTTIEDLRKLDV